MFGFGKKKNPTAKQQLYNMLAENSTSNEDILKKDIFSAEEAKLMGVEAKNRLRTANRREVFRQIKSYIGTGVNYVQLSPHLFADGNEVYFEGLGFKIKPVWMSNSTGEFFLEKPESANSINPPPVSYTQASFNQSHSLFNYTQYQHYMRVSWE